MSAKAVAGEQGDVELDSYPTSEGGGFYIFRKPKEILQRENLSI